MTPRNAFLLAALCLAPGLTSCVFSIGGGSRTRYVYETDDLSEFRARNRERLGRLQVGMTREEAVAILDRGSAMSTSGEITNPYRTEGMTDGNGGTLEIRYYYTGLVARDAVVSDDELTPVVIRDGKVLGWGHKVLEASMAKR